MRITLGIVAILLLLSCGAIARNDGRWDTLAFDKREWLKNQRIPGKGELCCSISDGVDAQEDIRYDANGVGHYVVTFVAAGVQYTKDVPDEAVLQEPNPVGVPVVWYYFVNAEPMVRCYAPGVKM